MPIYEFMCEECGNEVEVLQKMSDAPITECVACGKSTMKKKVSAAAFRLSGSGWYETDFKSGNKKNLKDNEKDKVAKPKKEKSADKTSNSKSSSNSSSKD